MKNGLPVGLVLFLLTGCMTGTSQTQTSPQQEGMAGAEATDKVTACLELVARGFNAPVERFESKLVSFEADGQDANIELSVRDKQGSNVRPNPFTCKWVSGKLVEARFKPVAIVE